MDAAPYVCAQLLRTLSKRIDWLNHHVSVESDGLHSILVQHIDAGAAHTRGGVVEVEGVAVCLWLQLIGELALRQVVGRELIGVEVEGLVHGNLHTLALLVEQLHIAVVGTQRMVLQSG